MRWSTEDVEYRYRPPKLEWLKSPIRSVLNTIGAGFMALATGGRARRVEPFEVEYTDRAMPLRGLPPSFQGYRIVQLTDLHTGLRTPVDFLRRVIGQINEMPHDLVAVTGDLISRGGDQVETVCQLLGELRPPVAVTFGNHDYARNWRTWSSTEVADALQAGLENRGITVLRNRAMPVQHDDGRVWIVGLEDMWSGRFSPGEALAGVDRHEPIIALSHNPDSVFALEHRGVQWVLSGHTHGGQIRIPVLGPIILPVKHKRLDMGHFEVGKAHLYVCRGIGFRIQVRFRCPPEVACFEMVAAP